MSKHEVNLTHCQEIREKIQTKVADLVQKLKEEESKLLDEVDDFERVEASSLAEKKARVKELEAMSKFGSISNSILTE